MWRSGLLVIISMVVILAGCGVEWLPENSVGIGTPDAFSFKSVTCAKPSVTVTSNEVVLAGLTGPATIKVANGQYGIADSTGNYPETSWFTGNGTVANGTKIKVRHTTAAASATNEMVITVLTVGTVSASFASNIGPYMLTSNQTSPACTDPVFEP